MSDIDSRISIQDNLSESGIDPDGQYVNERGDRYSDESSSYHRSEKADPSSKKKKYVKRFNTDQKQFVRVEFFPTSTALHSGIKNAITGTYQSVDGRNFKTGTIDEDLFFSVIIATGELGPNAPVLFYDNPEQYERHFFTKLPSKIKEAWVEKNQLALIEYNLRVNREESAARGNIVVK